MQKHSINVANRTSMEVIPVVGIDLAKNVFAIHGVNAAWQDSIGQAQCKA